MKRFDDLSEAERAYVLACAAAWKDTWTGEKVRHHLYAVEVDGDSMTGEGWVVSFRAATMFMAGDPMKWEEAVRDLVSGEVVAGAALTGAPAPSASRDCGTVGNTRGVALGL